jgi:hypothetical protein
MKVRVDFLPTTLEGDYCEVPGLVATCSRCGHSVEVYGTSDASERAACVMLREECPRCEKNFYQG